MKRLSFREREEVSVGPAGVITDQEAEGLSRLSPRLPAGTLNWGYRKLRFGPFCGVIGTDHLTIEILPKVEWGSQDDQAMRGLLIGMLARAGELGLKRIGGSQLALQHRHLLDVFIDDFCDQVRTALNGGIIERYLSKTENLCAIRGRIDMTAHLRANAFDLSRHLCEFDERTADNAYNQALKGTLLRLIEFTVGVRTRAGLMSLLHRFDGVQNQIVDADDIDDLQFDRTNQRWQHVFRRASWLLRRLFPDVRSGGTPGPALLFNIERLFERVLGRYLREQWRRTARDILQVELQGPQANLAASGFQLRPDVTLRSADEFLMILDAKWKRISTTEANCGVSSADAYQMNAYAGRFRCSRLALVYPASSGVPPGCVTKYVLETECQPTLGIWAVNVQELARGGGGPTGLEELLSSEVVGSQKRKSPNLVLAV
jgi:5-methylcytosine-specific restriction enzyme subunit McrC